MTDNNTNHDAEAGDGRRKRVIGTPSSSSGMSHDKAQEEVGREGAYPASETEPRTEDEQRKGERIAALWFLAAFLGGVGFVVSYFIIPAIFPSTPDDPAISDPDIAQLANVLMGVSLTVVLLGIGCGMTVWARRVMPHYEVSSDYDELPSAPEEKSSFGDFFMKGAHESGITKRPLLRRTLMLAMAPLAVLPVVLLRDLGPLPRKDLKHTMWEEGMRLVVEGTGRPLKVDDLAVGGMITALPENPENVGKPPAEHHHLSLDDQAEAVVMLIRMDPQVFGPAMTEQKREWAPQGVVAYSKICTHVGCPAALYEQDTHRILCPCHQSTFNAANGAEVTFGPAGRPLPQLPLKVDSEGYLVAAGDFPEPIGPAFWGMDKGDGE